MTNDPTQTARHMNVELRILLDVIKELETLSMQHDDIFIDELENIKEYYKVMLKKWGVYQHEKNQN